MPVNFTLCGDKFMGRGIFANSTVSYANYASNGTVRGMFESLDGSERPPLITLEGCRALCGITPEYYDWSQASATILTWILPVIGLLLQAPFESNAFWKTLFALARWTGSPIASLSYVLWNIKVNGKCSLMVDMSTAYEELPDEYSQFKQIRDSFYLLSVMNQYNIKVGMPSVEAEKLLRIALFSDSLQLEVVEEESRSLIRRRRKLAKSIREGRKEGVVPVFVSLLWFLFSLYLSLQAAFGQLGSNVTAHNLAMGLLLGWLPVFILCCIVDRNPVEVDRMRVKLNRLIDAVRMALLNEELRGTYIREIERPERDFSWTTILNNEDYFREDFFTRFAGQGRVRWHYGVAHPILAGIERSYVTEHARSWLRDSEEARTSLVRGPDVLDGLHSFDFREIWQILSATCIVILPAGGAFIISYWTPTVGLGCRSGGYLVFAVMALGTFVLECLFWWLVPEGSFWDHDPVSRFGSTIERILSRATAITWATPAREHSRRLLQTWQSLTSRDRLELVILSPMEVANAIWLVYIVLAQTFGAYRTCDCMTSRWGGQGGYMDFETATYYRANGVATYWGTGTALSCIVMALAFAFIVAEWCTQSHLSTKDYDSASRGLMRTRRFKKYTIYLRDVPDFVIERAKRMWFGRFRGRRSLVWSAYTKEESPGFQV